MTGTRRARSRWLVPLAVGTATWASLAAYLALMKWMLKYFSPKSYEFEASFPAYVHSPEVQAWGYHWYEHLEPLWAENWLIVPVWAGLGALAMALAVRRWVSARPPFDTPARH